MMQHFDEESIDEIIVGLLFGIAIHHRKIPDDYKIVVEYLISNGLLNIVLATGTLASGINTPCKTVVIVHDSPFLDEVQLHQMIGRAGRRGIEDTGHVIFLCLDE